MEANITPSRGYYSGPRPILGDAARVNGDCGCREPRGDVSSYHIDSEAALAAFVAFVGGLNKGAGPTSKPT